MSKRPTLTAALVVLLVSVPVLFAGILAADGNRWILAGVIAMLLVSNFTPAIADFTVSMLLFVVFALSILNGLWLVLLLGGIIPAAAMLMGRKYFGRTIWPLED